MKFRSFIQLDGKTATGIPVPAEVVESLGSGKRVAVSVTIKEHTYRSTVTPRGGQFMLPISAENRELAGVKAGDEVEVGIELDTAPREVTLPADFKEALDGDEGARNFFEGLSRSTRQRIVLSIEGAKTAETRQRRLAKALSDLHEGRA